MDQKIDFLDNSEPNNAYICMCLRIKTHFIDVFLAFYFIMQIGCIGVSYFCIQRRK